MSDERSATNWAQLIYALHAVSLLTGILTAASVVGAFLTGWPSIIAVVLNYIKRGDARGTWLESHFTVADPHVLVGTALGVSMLRFRRDDPRHRDHHRLAATWHRCVVVYLSSRARVDGPERSAAHPRRKTRRPGLREGLSMRVFLRGPTLDGGPAVTAPGESTPAPLRRSGRTSSAAKTASR